MDLWTVVDSTWQRPEGAMSAPGGALFGSEEQARAAAAELARRRPGVRFMVARLVKVASCATPVEPLQWSE